jgi:hypothetical protein
MDDEERSAGLQAALLLCAMSGVTALVARAGIPDRQRARQHLDQDGRQPHGGGQHGG